MVAVFATLGIVWASAPALASASGGSASESRLEGTPLTSTTELSPEPMTTTTAPPPPSPIPRAIGGAGAASVPATSGTRLPADQPAGCDAAVPGTYSPATEAEFRATMTRAWLLCAPPSLFGATEAGFELRADGRWSKLERNPGGGLTRAAGWGNEGSWETIDTSAMNGAPTFQLNFRIDGDGSIFTIPQFGDMSKVRVATAGSVVTDYVPVPAGTPILPVDPPARGGIGCDATEEPYAPATEAEFRTAMIGAWLLCAEPSFLGTAEAGLEIRADGRWTKLASAPGRGLVRLGGTGNEGTWETVDTSAMNGRPTFQINFLLDGGGSVPIIPAFSAHASRVSKVRLNNFGWLIADYIPLPPGAQITG